MRREGKAAQRAHDGPCEEDGKQDRDEDDRGHDRSERRTLVAHGAGERPVVVGDQEHIVGDRNCSRDHRRQVGRIADRAFGLSAALRPDGFGPGLQPVDWGLDEIVQGLGADEEVEAAVEPACDVLGPFLGVGILELVGRPGDPPAVDQQRSVGAVDPHPAVARPGDRCKHRGPILLRDVGEGLGGGGRFDPGLARALLAQTIAIGVEKQNAEREQRQRQHVHRENAVPERPPSRPTQGQVGVLVSDRRIGIRRHKGSRLHRTPGLLRGISGESA